ncbi:ABC transporter permease [Weissella confusa]|uniref:ABC transporter permease n=1 Tax=Weissella confusa TaxID=1583 RepID=UPI0035A2D757
MPNLGRLLRANLKTDLKLIIVWVVINAAMIVSGLAKIVNLYSGDGDIAKLRQMMDAPMMVALFTKIPGGDHVTIALVLGAIMLPLMATLTGLMSVQLAIRGTRKMEESGETDLILATATPKTVPVIAVALELVIVNIINGLGMYVVWLSMPMTGANQAGYLVFVGLMVAFGIFMGGVALIGSQVFADSRSANFFGYGFLAGIYFLRSMIDVKHWHGLTWLSPFNWLESASVFGKNDSWAISVMVIIGILLGLVAVRLSQHRDLGASLLQMTGRGRQHAPASLRGFTTLFMRVEAKVIVGWFIAILVFAAMFGSIFGDVQEVLSGSTQIETIVGVKATTVMTRTLYAHFLEMIAMFMVLFVTLMSLNVMQRYLQDRRNGSLNLIAGQPVGRLRLFTTYTLTAAVAGVIAFAVGILVAWHVGNSSVTGSIPAEQIQRVLIGYLPTLLASFGVGALLLGWVPRLFGVLYAYFGIFFLLTYLRNLLDLPKWFLRLSPYGWSANIPVSTPNTAVMVTMSLIAVACFVLGYIGFKHRDLV